MNTFPDIPAAKAALRREMRALLREITPSEREEGSGRICVVLQSDESWLPGEGTVALFAGLAEEPALLDLLPWLHGKGLKTALFAVGEAGVMRPHRVDSPGDLVAGPFGVLMPDATRCPEVELGELGAVLLPGLAFGVCDGSRLGRGKGYYDRILAGLRRDASVIGIGFARQLRPTVPREAHDRCVQAIVTEEGWNRVPSPD